MVQLRKIVEPSGARVLLKLESANPSALGSHEEGIFAGTSTGANIVAALDVASRLPSTATVVTIAVDSGLRYLSTELYA